MIEKTVMRIQQFDILTSVDSDEPLQPPFKLSNSKLCSVSSLTVIKYSSAYAQADLSLCKSLEYSMTVKLLTDC